MQYPKTCENKIDKKSLRRKQSACLNLNKGYFFKHHKPNICYMKDRKRAFMGETIEWKGKQEEKSQMANSFTWANERTEKEKKNQEKIVEFYLDWWS